MLLVFLRKSKPFCIFCILSPPNYNLLGRRQISPLRLRSVSFPLQPSHRAVVFFDPDTLGTIVLPVFYEREIGGLVFLAGDLVRNFVDLVKETEGREVHLQSLTSGSIYAFEDYHLKKYGIFDGPTTPRSRWLRGRTCSKGRRWHPSKSGERIRSEGRGKIR